MCMARPRGHARGTLRALCRDGVALGGGSKDGVGGSKRTVLAAPGMARDQRVEPPTAANAASRSYLLFPTV